MELKTKLLIGFLLLINQLNFAQNCTPSHEYRFDGNALDLVGSSTTIVHGATLTTDRFGNADQAYYFDGTDDYIEIDTSLITDSTFTITAWVQKEQGAGNYPIFCQRSSVAASFQPTILLDAENTLDSGYIFLRTSTTSGTAASYQADTSQIWRHYAASFDGDTIRFYIDGQLKVSKAFSTNGGVFDSNIDHILIGAHFYSTTQQFFKGKIDELKIYDCAFTGSNIPTCFTEITIDTTISSGESFTVGANTYTTNGTYIDTIPSSSNDCDTIITTNLSVLPPNSIASLSNNNIKAFPTPFNNLITIQLPYNRVDSKIIITDLLGKRQDVQMKSVGEHVEIDGSNLAKGSYIIHVSEVGRIKILKK